MSCIHECFPLKVSILNLISLPSPLLLVCSYTNIHTCPPSSKAEYCESNLVTDESLCAELVGLSSLLAQVGGLAFIFSWMHGLTGRFLLNVTLPPCRC